MSNKIKLLILPILILTTSCGNDTGSGNPGGGLGTGPCSGICKTFVTTSTTITGDLLTVGKAIDNSVTTGIAGADALCEDDPAKPSGTYKALIVDGVNRIASVNSNTGDGQVDWVLKKDTSYTRANGSTVIMNTGSNALVLFNPNGLLIGFVIDPTQYWTGISSDWTNNSITILDCKSWTSALSTDLGTVGEGGNIDSNAISVPIPIACDSIEKQLLCIQQ